MISKKMFIMIIEKLREYNEIEEEIRKASEKLDFFEVSINIGQDLTIDIMQEIFKDKENDWIGYYIYELDFGKRYEDGMITDNGLNIHLKTPEDLYNIIVENFEREGKNNE